VSIKTSRSRTGKSDRHRKPTRSSWPRRALEAARRPDPSVSPESCGNDTSIRESVVKKNLSSRVMAITLLAALAIPVQLSTQHFAHYKFYDLGTFGGPQSFVSAPSPFARVLNNQGTVVGWADTSTADPYGSPFCLNPECNVVHAFQWQNGISNVGVYGSGSSSQAFWISSTGLIAGMSQNGAIDPSWPGFPEMRAVLWTNGSIQNLGTLEQGNESAALAVNKLGQVVGASTNCGTAPNCKNEATALFDPNAFWGWNKPTRAFLWQDGQNGPTIKDLETLGGSDAAAIFINDNIQNNGVGQIVGESYINAAPSAYCSQIGAALTTGAFLWQNNGPMQNLGSFGGTCTYPLDLNDLGQVVGLSTEKGDRVQDAFYWDGSLHKLPNANGGPRASGVALNNLGVAVGWASLAGDVLPAHAALWMNSTSAMTDLGTVAGDACSFAFAVNLSGQVVGISTPVGSSTPCDFDQVRAFVWQNGSMVDLNTLIPANSDLYLVDPETINDLGEIAGIGVDASGNEHAFLLIPCSVGDSACRGSTAGPAFTPPKNKIQLGFARTGTTK
jgi:probable HAF family extracellular repeat protein